MKTAISGMIAIAALAISMPVNGQTVSGPGAEQVAAADAQKKALDALPWIKAPAKPPVTSRASLALTPDVQFLDAKGSASFLKMTGNLPDGENFILFSNKTGWWADYMFADIGYVKDDEKIDADALLAEIKSGDEAQNEARKEQGLEPLTTVGWAVPPHYDAATHNLEYGLTLAAPSGQNINYRMRILGRRGVMDATLVTSAETIKQDLAEFRAVNKGFAFVQDESYAAFKEGDKVSEYGLAALVTGGAAAAALKGGLFKGLLIFLAKFWKLIALGVAGLFFGLRKVFSKGDDLGPPPAA